MGLHVSLGRVRVEFRLPTHEDMGPGHLGITENQMEKKMDNYMETRVI